MAIKDMKQKDSVSVLDPAKGAYCEVSIEALRKQLSALGFSDEQVEERIAALKPKEE